MIGRLNHVAIVVPDLAAATKTYAGTLGARVSAPVDMPAHGVTTVFVELANTKIELLHPLGEGSPIAKFLADHPSGGMHHVCYEVDDIFAARDRLKAEGARVRARPNDRCARKADDAEESPMDDARSGDRLGADFCGCSVRLAAGARRAGAAAPACTLKPAGS